ncbi:putative peptide ABC transporter permease protein y4tP [[Clostridium] ultunense Esp]|uniref:Putative peptide ABC transporter permease protein y4tP n=1 Tax=[Clostridium] ultunense Esp TaxID=1288971 RepID=M1ZFS8_9FIRM|nr:ABC transporter permease [Schnuerera ultunensis]CCQ97219.1 putative peptide ABC transporter permease protein y4tP [[Clostridium] ultunense Esp]SHD75697.1 putative peptide ABC transporter permease protein y4tP [[Clostridium] ultunense Esp]
MLKFIIKRILSSIPVILVVITFVFFIMRVIPGDPAILILGDEANSKDVEILREKMGLNEPLLVQYVNYVKDILTGNWGNSYYNNESVFKNIKDRLEPTVLIVIYSTLISIFLGVPLGILAARYRNTFLDYTLTTASVFGLSIPMFWLGIMMVFLFGVKLRWFPVQGYKEIQEVGLKTALYYVSMPSIALGLQSVASIARYTRSAMLDVLNNDYIKTARAKGLPVNKVFYKHALKNSLSPVVTQIGFSMVSMLGGAVVIETVFNIPGMGKLAYDSLMRRDYAQEQAIILYMALVFVFVNIIVDIIYKYLDPRIELD